MPLLLSRALVLLLAALVPCPTLGGQAPYSRGADVPVSSGDRVYLADQLSNSVSVVDPAAGKLVGVIRLGQPLASALKPVYKGQLLVHGLGYSPDSKTLVAVCVGSNGVVFMDTGSHLVKHVTYVGRAPHEAMYTPDGKEVWVTIRGQDFIQVLDAETYEPKDKIKVPEGPGMVVFSPDGTYAYVCSSFTAMTVVVDTAAKKVVAHVSQASAFCPNIAASPDGKQVWMTLKDTGRVQVFEATPPFSNLSTLATGAITNHVNFATRDGQQLAYITVGGSNQVKVFTTNFTAGSSPELVAEVSVGELPHGLWPSGDGSRMWVGLENGNALQAIDTRTQRLVGGRIDIGGQSPQAMVYVPNAVPADRASSSNATGNLTASTEADGSRRLRLVSVGNSSHSTGSVVVNRQGPIDALMAATSGLTPGKWYVLALAPHADGSGALQPLASFKAMPDGAALVSSIGPFRSVLFGDAKAAYVVVAAQDGEGGRLGDVLQVEAAPLPTDTQAGASRRRRRHLRA